MDTMWSIGLPSDQWLTIHGDPVFDQLSWVSSNTDILASSEFMGFPPDPRELPEPKLEQALLSSLQRFHERHDAFDWNSQERLKLAAAETDLREVLLDADDLYRSELSQNSVDELVTAFDDILEGMLPQTLNAKQRSIIQSRSVMTCILKCASLSALAIKEITLALSDENLLRSQRGELLDARTYHVAYLGTLANDLWWDNDLGEDLVLWDGELDHNLLRQTKCSSGEASPMTAKQVELLKSSEFAEPLAQVHAEVQELFGLDVQTVLRKVGDAICKITSNGGPMYDMREANKRQVRETHHEYPHSILINGDPEVMSLEHRKWWQASYTRGESGRYGPRGDAYSRLRLMISKYDNEADEQ